MTANSSRDGAISAQGASGGRRVLFAILGIVLLLALAGGALYWISNSFGSSGSATARSENKARSYRTLSRVELRAEANATSRLVVTLREGTTVSGVPAGSHDGVEWLEITAVDGTKGFVPKTMLKELGPSANTSEITGGTRRLVTSTTVNLRETPSMSGKILGVAEGGTRLVSDGSIQSEGEDWLRVPLDGQTTVFIMQRFTTSDDDAGSGEGIEGDANSAIGVRGFAVQVANVQATPLEDARVVRALALQEEVRIIGQTNTGRSWYVLRLTDGSQGFAPREAIRIDPNANRWVYPDGTLAPGPNIPKGSTVPVVAGSTRQNSGGQQSTRPQNGSRNNNRNSNNTRPNDESKGSKTNAGANNPSSPTPVPVPVVSDQVPVVPSPTPAPTEPGPQ